MELNEILDSYKDHIAKIDGYKQMNPSDKKKLLTMPFYLQKRSELPEPKHGQKEWDLFTRMYGTSWSEYDDLQFDEEDKITEFNYENYLS